MPTPLDLRLHELSRIICTSQNQAVVAEAAREHRSLCRQHTVMPVVPAKLGAADIDARISSVLDAVRQLYAETNTPVSMGDIAQATGISVLYAGIYVRQLVETDHIRTTHSEHTHHTYAIPI